ncbi:MULTISPECIES: acyltransferase family protein [Nocardiopsis]|uniref:Acyltransferase n=1 Tax=Nocardiopsis changdeensis TaxID=2831969 RepID=A0ABX8BH62_9ACTN|nr:MULTISPECIES: acyltransferase family protein [Nocardiopsis]QUX21557.1 acyltransferase [Nocardiopsis changdeensis]QYX37490.1 acyltransferase [Nocardiopsis sp. MT53]
MSSAPASAATERRFRPEVQGLRAVAVLLVLVYHLDPSLLPGGYVGVDVFFVISGFLITSLLYREASGQGRVSVARFYARRVRRLLPAATVVLVVTGAASYFLLPVTRLTDTMWQLVASAAYVENLYLARQSVDYLASEVAPSPVQHFWSLSVEEQFYLVWPLLFILWAALRRRGAGTGTLVALLGSLLAASLLWSVATTGGEPSAYFLPTTRAWELAVGGLLAVGLAHGRLSERVRLPLGWAGLAAIVAAAVFYDEATPFPGWAALLPVLGAAAVIAAEHVQGPLSASAPLSTAPARWVGDVSYSLYLWHWPLIVLALAVTGRDELGWALAAAVGTASLLLAWATKVWVEDPVRDHRLVRGGRGALAAAVSGVLVVAAVGATLYVRVDRVESVEFDPSVHVGPQALGQAPTGDPVYPPPVRAEDDAPVLYDDDCQASQTAAAPEDPCVYGPEDADRTVAVVGDSHSAQWVPALMGLGEERGWRLVLYTKSSCAFTDTMTKGPEGGPYESCQEWNRAVVEELTELRPDLVVTSSSTSAVPAQGGEEDRVPMLAEGMTRLWGELGEVSGPIVALRDTPRQRRDVVECVARNPEDPGECTIPLSEAFKRDDPQERAVDSLPGETALVDMSDLFCAGGECPAVIGNVMVYRDSGHITNTYVSLLTDHLGERLDEALS